MPVVLPYFPVNYFPVILCPTLVICHLQARKLVFTTVDRAVSYYETNRWDADPDPESSLPPDASTPDKYSKPFPLFVRNTVPALVLHRGSYELSGRVYASGGMGVPQSLTMVSNEAGGGVLQSCS